MKFTKIHNGFKKNGHGASYVSECGRIKLSLSISSKSVAIKDGRHTVGRRTLNSRWYNVSIRGDVFGLNDEKYFSPLFLDVKTLKDAETIDEKIRELKPCLLYWPEEGREPTLYMEGVKDSARLEHKVVDLPVNI